GTSHWYALSGTSHENQRKLLPLAIKGATREKLRKAIEELENPTAGEEAPRFKSIPLELSDGTKVTFKFKGDVTLQDAIRAAQQAKEDLEAAVKNHHDAKSLKSWMANRGKSTKKAMA